MNTDRRDFLGLLTAASLVTLAAQAAKAASIEAVLFDGFAIFDSRPVAALAEELAPGRGAQLMDAWRTRQFEYTWLRTLTNRYVDFWQVTGEALDYAARARQVALSSAQREQLLQSYLRLPAWPDARAGLESLRGAGLRLALLTNFSESMLAANLKNSGLADLFHVALSTDRVRAYKPDPRAYEMGTRTFDMPKERMVFAAFGGWDAAGAKAFGYPTFWMNRAGAPAEELGLAADASGTKMSELVGFVRSR